VLTGAAVILFVVGALNILSSFLLFRLGALGAVFGLLALAVGAAGIYAGSQVLALNEKGRTMGMAVAGISLALGIYTVTQGNYYAVVGLALNGFVLWALNTNAKEFHAA
jgi:hypothetical protein